MNTIMTAMILGGLGGLARSALGLLKVMSVKREILWKYFLITAMVSILIGLVAGTLFSFDPGASLLSGYAGTDILDGIYKTFAAQKVILVSDGKKS